MDKRTPIFVLTGFLGSGKSTLLSACVREIEMDRTAVIVNEFGEVGLDHLLVTKGGEDTVLLDSGCLCCLSNNQIQDTLLVLHGRRKRNEISFDRVVIETSGLAEPGPMLRPLLVDSFVQRNFRLALVTATADALLAQRQLADYEEARHQAASADRIVITKCDIATPKDINDTEASVRVFNAEAELVHAPNGVPATQILGFNIANEDLLKARVDRIPHHSHESSHQHSQGIESRAFHFPEPVTWARYARWLDRLRGIDGKNLLRTKGILKFDDGEFRIIQGVQHFFAPPTPLFGDTPAPFLVMITQNVDQQMLESLANELQTKGR